MSEMTTELRTQYAGIPADSPELRALVEDLKSPDRAGAVILGGPGTGKSSLVQAALELSGLAENVHTVQCTQSLREVPYGALVPLLTELDELSTPVSVLRSLQQLGANPVIVVVDVQYLDAASAFVLAQLVQNRAATLLASGTGLVGRESGIAALSDTGMLRTIHLKPGDPQRVRRQCEQTLGGPLTLGAARTIHGMTGGNPRLVKAFLESALHQGALTRAQGPSVLPGRPAPWVLLRPSPDADAWLIDTVEAMQAALLPGERECLDLVALAGETSRAHLRAVAGDHVQDLLETGFLKESGPDSVTMAALMHAEVLRACIPPGRSLDLFSRWQAVGGSFRDRPTARAVLWALECGYPVDLEDVIDAGYRALGTKDWPTARALAPFLAGRDDPRADLLVAELMLVGGRTWTARAELEQLAARSADPDYRIEVLGLLAMDHVRKGQAPHGWAALPKALAGVREHLVDPLELPEPLGAMTELLLDPAMDDRREELLETSQALVEDHGTDSGTRAILLLLQSDVLGLAGRSQEAIAAARQAFNLGIGSPVFSARFGVNALVQLVLNLLMAGEVEEAHRVLDTQDALAPRQWHQRSGTVLALRAMVDMAHGSTPEAVSALHDAVVELRQHDPAQLLLLAEAMLTPARVALSPAPLDPGAEERARQPQQGSRGRWLWSLALCSIAEDRTKVLSEEHRPLWRRILEDPRLHQDVVVRREILFSVLVLRSPQTEDDGLMARLHELCTGLDGRRSRILGRVLDPALEDDPRGLAAVAEQAAASGEVLPAAIAWARLVLLHHGAGDLRRRGEALRRLKRLEVSSGRQFPPFVSGALALGELTAREQEIVDLAASGMSNAEVAEKLFVSQRTVEGHLYRVFTKLGITERSELRDLPV
ncbi:MAG TPA: LuxR C-terminal-related transcriptional regulator [Citricoccus sp.]